MQALLFRCVRHKVVTSRVSVCMQGDPLATEPGISVIILPQMRILQRNLKCTTDTFLFISHTTNVLLSKFLCNIFIGVRIIKEMPGSVASGTRCIKVKCSRYRPGVAQRLGRGIALLFHDHGTRRRWVVSSTPRPHFPPGKTRYPLYRRLGGPQDLSGRAENLVPTGIRSRTVQHVAQSLYWLSYPAHTQKFNEWKIPWKKVCVKTRSQMGGLYGERILVPAEYERMEESVTWQEYLEVN
jgi:hypothetical protein